MHCSRLCWLLILVCIVLLVGGRHFTHKRRRQLPTKELLIAGLFPLAQNPEASRLGRGVLPAALLAREHINHHSNILRGYQLQLDVNNTACDAALGIKAFLDMLHKKPGKRLMVFGSACTEVTGPTAQASQFLHLAQLSYADTHSMYEYRKFPNLYRIVPSESQFDYARLELLRQFNWTWVATLHQNEPRYSLAHNNLLTTIAEDRAFKIIVQQTFTDLTEVREALTKLRDNKARIILGSFNETWARVVFCEAYHTHMYGRKYQWIIWGGYTKDWWLEETDTNCTSEQLITALNGHFSTDILPLSLDGQKTIAQLSAGEYEDEYNKRKGHDYSRFHGYTYDGVWAMAKAISIVIQELPFNTSIDMFKYKDPFWSERFLSALNHTEFIGVTGPVRFHNNERVGRILINQFQVKDEASSSAREEIIALYHNDTSCMDFEVSSVSIFWHGPQAPRDRTIEEERLVHLSTTAFISMAGLAIAGITLAVFFLVVNTKYRNHKYIKMSSPYLNNIIICGCIMTYLSVILLGIDTGIVREDEIPAVCTARLWVLTIGFTSAFGAMFSKTWRVHAIFTNIKLNKKVIKDYQLFLIVGVLLLMDIIILLTWQFQDPFSYATQNLTDIEDIQKDLLIKPRIGLCRSEFMTIYLGVMYAFKGILMAFGCFLAWETRYVSIPALNDSKYIGMSVYNVVIMCVIGVAISILLADQQEYAFIIISIFIVFCTTITLCLVFVPKVVELRKNPNPESKRVRATLKSVKPNNRESFTADIQNRIKALQDQNSKLKDANLTKSSELDRLISELGEEARELLQKRREARPRSRPKINFKGVSSNEDEGASATSSRDESSQDEGSDQWPVIETSAVTKCLYVHYKPRKNSVEGNTICTTVSEPSSNSFRTQVANSTLPTISDVEESEHASSKTPVTSPAKEMDVFGGVYVGGPEPVIRQRSVKRGKPSLTKDMHNYNSHDGKSDLKKPVTRSSKSAPLLTHADVVPIKSIMKHPPPTHFYEPVSQNEPNSSSFSEPDITEASPPEKDKPASQLLVIDIPAEERSKSPVSNHVDLKRLNLRCDVIASL